MALEYNFMVTSMHKKVVPMQNKNGMSHKIESRNFLLVYLKNYTPRAKILHSKLRNLLLTNFRNFKKITYLKISYRYF